MFCMGNNEHIDIGEQSTAKKIENYIFKYDDLLGKGNFGSAYSGFDVNTGKTVAIKVIKMSSIKSKINQKLLQNQIQILKNLKNHPNILKCHDVFTSVNNCYIITQLCDHDLQKDLINKGKFKQSQIKQLVYGIYKGLQQLNKNSIIHRDIKISNIFINTNGTPKIADFGFAVKSNTRFKDLNIGSPLYMSPQGLMHNQYGPKTDVWSFGVLLYELINGQTPLERCKTDQQLRQQILRLPKFYNPISSQLKQVIQACLTVDQRKRPSISQLGNFIYFRKLFSEIQGRRYSLKDSSNRSTQGSQCHYRGKFYINQISYENSLSLLHYCRLLHKINKKYLNSQIISQFILTLSHQLSKMKISSLNQQYQKLKHVLCEYYNKFVLQYNDMKIQVKPRELLNEIDRLMKYYWEKQQNMGLNNSNSNRHSSGNLNLNLNNSNNSNNSYRHSSGNLINVNNSISVNSININNSMTGQNNNKCYQLEVLKVLDAQTKVFIYSIQHQNPDIFMKNSEAKAIIQNGRLLI